MPEIRNIKVLAGYANKLSFIGELFTPGGSLAVAGVSKALEGLAGLISDYEGKQTNNSELFFVEFTVLCHQAFLNALKDRLKGKELKIAADGYLPGTTELAQVWEIDIEVEPESGALAVFDLYRKHLEIILEDNGVPGIPQFVEDIQKQAGREFDLLTTKEEGWVHRFRMLRNSIRAGKGDRIAGDRTGIIHLPVSLGDLFTGREELMDQMTLKTNELAQIQALTGQAGVGKTRLAVECAWRQRESYDGVFLIRADNREEFFSGFAGLSGSHLLDLPEHEISDQEVKFRAVLKWLQKGRFLLILDNIDTPEAQRLVFDHLPSLTQCRIILTSRLDNWPVGVNQSRLSELTRQQSIDYLLQATGHGKLTESLNELVTLLEGLPLALELAAGYIKTQRTSFDGYLGLWKKHQKEVLDWYRSPPMMYPSSITNLEHASD